MTLHRLAAGLCLSLLLCTSVSAAPHAEKAVPAKQITVSPKASAADEAVSSAVQKQPEDALDALPEWEKRYVKETRITIENNIDSLMEGIRSREDLADSIDTFCRTWEKWTASKLFILDDDRDIDVYGNLYSLQVICRTLRLAAADWDEAAASEASQKALTKADWLEKRSRRLAEPVAEIIRNQSYSSFLPRRIEIMQDMLPYVDICYRERGFGERIRAGQAQ